MSGAKGSKDQPGGAYKRNFNKGGAGRFKLRIARGKGTRSKTRG